MNDYYDILHNLQKNKTRLYVYLNDTLDQYSSCHGGMINGNIPMENLIDKTLFKKMVKFEELTGGGGILYFEGWQEVCNDVGIYSGMDFMYKLTSNKLTIENIYDNFILFKSVEGDIPYTVNMADISRLKIKITQ